MPMLVKNSVELTWQEKNLLRELVEQDIEALNVSLRAIGRWTERLEQRCALLGSIQAKLEGAT